MNKAELIAAVAEKAALSKKDSEAAVNAALEAIAAALKDGDKVQLVGFGSFEVKKRAARTGRNPRTKEVVEIPASQVPVFKAGKALKDAVGKSSFARPGGASADAPPLFPPLPARCRALCEGREQQEWGGAGTGMFEERSVWNIPCVWTSI